MGDKNRDIAEYYKKRSRGKQDDELLDRIVGGGRRERRAKAEERLFKRAYRDKKVRKRRTYTVRPGDSWFSIAKNELGDYWYAGDLARANPGFDVINPGAIIHLPDVDEDEAAVITYEDFESLKDIQDKVEAAQKASPEEEGAAEADVLDVYEERKAGFEELNEDGYLGLSEEEIEAAAQTVMQTVREFGYQPEEDDIGSFKQAALSREALPQNDALQTSPHDGRRGASERSNAVKPEPAETPTQEVETTEAVLEELPSYTEMVTAEETSWGQWQAAFDGVGIEWQDAEGNLNIESVSTFIADDIKVNKEQYAQELGIGVDELAEVSSGRVAGWLDAVETHNLQDYFSVRTLMEQTDQEMFGFIIDVRIGIGTDSPLMSIEDYARIYEGRTEEVKETLDNIGAATTMVALALYRVAIENDMDLGNTPQEVFQTVFGTPQFRFSDDPVDYGGEPGTTCFSTGGGFNCTTNFVKAFATQLGGHEFGHILRGRIQARYLLEIPGNISEEEQEELAKINEYRAGLFSPYNNLANSDLEYLDENGTRNADPYQEDTEEIKWQWHTTELYPNSNSPNTTNEIFGEMFLAWAFDAFADNGVGTEFNDWMEGMMPTWMLHAAESYNDSWLED